MSKERANNKGFTIIEVVLVLAIAGLIFLVVFLALPALQRGQRDTQRKSDLSRFMSQVTSFQSNNQGALPSVTASAPWNTFVGNYLTVGGSSFADPDGSNYTVTWAGTMPVASPTPASGAILVYANATTGFKCDPTAAVGLATGAGARSFAAVIKQEQGVYYCQSN